MYSVYQTEGIILRSALLGEADSHYSILTEELGMISAEAKGVRKMESKLRCSLLPFALADFSLIRGRGRWRIASAALKRNLTGELKGRGPIRQILARAGTLLCRLVQGEERNDMLYKNFRNGAVFLCEKKPEEQLLRSTEYLLALRILYSLGYLGHLPGWNDFTSTLTFDEQMLTQIQNMKGDVVEVINRSLRESHL
ncbi:MAG: recombination protein O N-terminal domain-containing protein [Candidatus Taylorbacteria bacterium]|nr:recombination protein O N-terminal domain-containing protein [Candidatus Taylorbacteria bacterium]